jgi:hypothetical protein
MAQQSISDDAVVAVFPHHRDAEAAVRKLAGDGFDMTHFSIVGKGYHTEETVVGFYNYGDRIKLWGKNGAFWGGIWSLFFGSVFLTIPVVGHIMVLGHLAAMVIAGIEGAVLVGGLSAIGAALFSIGIPKDSVILYEEAIKADGFLVVAHGPASEMARAKAIFDANNPTRVDVHSGLTAPAPSVHSHPIDTAS